MKPTTVYLSEKTEANPIRNSQFAIRNYELQIIFVKFSREKRGTVVEGRIKS
jgi:hypothetical protein